MYDKLLDFILTSSIAIYILLGVSLSFIISILGGKNKSMQAAILNAFECSLYTAAISLPLLEYWDFLPHSIALLVGSFVGTIGASGIKEIFVYLKRRIMRIDPPETSQYRYEDTQYYPYSHQRHRNNKQDKIFEPEKKIKREEPPMPDDLR